MADQQQYFDRWYADLARSPGRDALVQRHLGLPGHVRPNNTLPWGAYDEIAGSLGIGPGGRLLDLGCGRGSVGIELAARTGCALVGVDFSGEALTQAKVQADEQAVSAVLWQGWLEGTGVPDGHVDAVVCIDSVQFAEPPQAVYAEIRRVLRPGGRVVITTWEPVDRFGAAVPERLLRVDVHAGLVAAGFVDIVLKQRDDWRLVEHALWSEAATVDPGGDPALVSLRDEARRSLQAWPTLRRVHATATAP